jgi:RNase P/RNase MRP subunit POP5
MRLVKRYFAVLTSRPEGHWVGEVRESLTKLYGVTSAHEVTLKVMETREWGFIIRALMKDGGTAEKVVMALSFTTDGGGWLRPLHASGTLKALRTKLKDAGLFSSKSG